MVKQMVYSFGAGQADGDGSMKELLGGKGANLAEMTRIKLPVPPGFTITTEVCALYSENPQNFPDAELKKQVDNAIVKFEEQMGKKIRRYEKPTACFRALRRS